MFHKLSVYWLVLGQDNRGGERPLPEIERTGHVLDHPIAFPEGAYLKCLFASAP